MKKKNEYWPGNGRYSFLIFFGFLPIKRGRGFRIAG